MSTSFTPGRDLNLLSQLPTATALFTTFATGHFVKPGECVQPVKATEAMSASSIFTSVTGAYRQFIVAAAIEPGFNKTDAVTDRRFVLKPGQPLCRLDAAVCA
jgi:hypothetical protein